MFDRATTVAGKIVSRMLSDEHVFSWVQRGLSFTLETRRLFDRNVERFLSSMSVPSHADLERLEERLESIDQELASLTRRLENAARTKRRGPRVASP